MKIGPAYLGWREVTILISEFIVILFFGLFILYGDNTNPDTSRANEDSSQYIINHYYPFFMDVHVMIFVGFGFLMIFLKSFSWSAVALNLFLAAWAMEVAVLTGTFWH